MAAGAMTNRRPKIKDWRLVQAVAVLRQRGLSPEETSRALGLPRTRINTLLRRGFKDGRPRFFGLFHLAPKRFVSPP